MLMLSHTQLSATPWTVALEAPLSMGFLRQEHRSGLPFPPLGESSRSPRDQTHVFGVSCIAGRFFTSWAIGEAQLSAYSISSKMLKCFTWPVFQIPIEIFWGRNYCFIQMLNWKKNVGPICTKVLFWLVGILRESGMGSPAFEPLAMCPKAGHFSLTISSGFQLPPLLIIIIIFIESKWICLW